jgi:predicted nicotinamide N-methyase
VRGPNLDLQQFIRANLPIAPVPAIPEIRLHKAGPASGLRRLAELDEHGFGSPYWAYYWGGGLALARHILDRPETVAGRRVLDLGAGSGIVGIAAANGVTISALLADLTAGPPPSVDVVAVGDLFYERDLAERVTAFLDRCLIAGIDVLIGDPWRAFLPHPRLQLIAEYPVLEFGEAENAATKPSAVFSLMPPTPGPG